jgi:hypothetical protein
MATARAAILRDAAKRPLVRMTAVILAPKKREFHLSTENALLDIA